MTPNHNQVYCTSTDKNFKISPVKDLNFNHYKYIPVSGRGSGNNDLLSPLELKTLNLMNLKKVKVKNPVNNSHIYSLMKINYSQIVK
jgi:hypothetical protein